MAGFARTLIASVTGAGALTWTVISEEGSVVAVGVATFLFPNNGKRHQVQVVDGSNSAGAFAYRLNYVGDGGTVRLLDVVAPAAGEVLKTFAVEAPLIEVIGNGTRGLTATALVAGLVLGLRAGRLPGGNRS